MWYKLLSVLLLAALPYFFSLHADFVFDDSEAILKNKDVVDDSWKNPFYNDFWGTNIKSNLSHKSYRPLTILTFRINYLTNNKLLSPLHFKITNLICHMICSVLVWVCYKIILKDNYDKSNIDLAFIGSLLFCVHPVHVEAVSGIVGRADVLAGISFFLSFILYCKTFKASRLKSILYLLLCTILAGVSMLFKENGVTVLGFIFIYEIINHLNLKKVHHAKKWNFSLRNTHLNTNGMSVIKIVVISSSASVLLFVRWRIMGGVKPQFEAIDNPAASSEEYFTKAATYSYIYFINILLLVWPQWLCYDWSMGCVPLIKDYLDLRILFPLAIYAYGISLVFAVFSKKNSAFSRRIIMVSVSLMIIPYLPASNIFFPVGFVVAERILYIPSAGYCLMLSVGIRKLAKYNSKLVKMAVYFIILINALRCHHRSLDWQTEYRLFIKGLLVCPANAKVRYNVAKVADARNYSDWALMEYKEAIRLYPKYYQAMNNLANLLKNRKQYNEAENYLITAISLKYDFPAAWMNLGIVLAATRRYAQAEEAYSNALKYKKKYPDCYYNLGNMYLEVKDTKKALSSWYKAVELKPTHVLAWTNILALLDNTGQLMAALQKIPQALKELPNSPTIHFAVANIYGKLERYEEAEKYFKTAIKLFGSSVQSLHYANLGVLYHRWKKYDLAEEMYREALKINPHFTSAQKNLKSVLQIKKNVPS